MKKFAIVVCFVCVASLTKASVIADWTYQTASISGSSATFGPISPEVGSGSATGIHASSSTTWTGTSGSVSGNGSTKSFNVNTWAIGDYFQFQASSAGYQNIIVSWDQASSTTGSTGFKLQYSTDGSIFTDFTGYTVNTDSGSWTSSSTITADHYSYDLSSITTLNNAAAIYFRLTDTNSPSSNSGTDRNDNFTISGTAAVPEPVVSGLISAIGLLGICGVSIWRKHSTANRA
jgi:hypothetical protein